MSTGLARLLWRIRIPAAVVILLGAMGLAPLVSFTDLDNDISAWISKSDPTYQTYERFRTEFGGGRVLMIALESPTLFTRDSLEFVRTITDDIRAKLKASLSL